MANTKSDTWESQIIITDRYIEYPLPEGIKRKISSGKWGTPTGGNYPPRPASRKKK